MMLHPSDEMCQQDLSTVRAMEADLSLYVIDKDGDAIPGLSAGVSASSAIPAKGTSATCSAESVLSAADPSVAGKIPPSKISAMSLRSSCSAGGKNEANKPCSPYLASPKREELLTGSNEDVRTHTHKYATFFKVSLSVSICCFQKRIFRSCFDTT